MIGHAARCGRMLAGVTSLALACTGWWAPGAAQQARTEVALEGRFEGKNGKPAGDLSGIACQPPVAGEHACFVVNDESPFAQLATLRDRRLLAGRTVDLIAGRGAPRRWCAARRGVRLRTGGQTLGGRQMPGPGHR